VIRNTSLADQSPKLVGGLSLRSSEMTEAFTIGHEELAILCDFVGGWGGKWAANNLQTDKRQALDRLITNGFLEPAADAITKYKHTDKTELLFAQLCVGISGG
jgi:hypothetical protein